MGKEKSKAERLVDDINNAVDRYKAENGDVGWDDGVDNLKECTECGLAECECDWESHCICGNYWCDGDCY